MPYQDEFEISPFVHLDDEERETFGNYVPNAYSVERVLKSRRAEKLEDMFGE